MEKLNMSVSHQRDRQLEASRRTRGRDIGSNCQRFEIRIAVRLFAESNLSMISLVLAIKASSA